MKAIIVPGVTDLNKGDQALVWESYRLVKDVNLFDDIYILNSGDTEEERIALCQQSIDRGFQMLDNILPHPRRGEHRGEEHIRESKIGLAKQIKNASFDFLSTKFLLTICNNLILVKKLFPEKFFNTVRSFNDADVIFVKGGGFIHSYGEKTALYLMWYFLFYVRLANKLDKKVVFLPNSYGPFDGLTVKRQVRHVFSKLDLIYAREHVSSDALGKLLKKEIPVEMDLGFFLNKGSQEEALKILNKYHLLPEDKIVGVTIRPWRFPGFNNPKEMYRTYIDSISVLINHIVKSGYKVALCNQSIGPNSHEDDRNAIKDLLQRVKHPDVIWINENLTCDILKAVYSNFYFFVGTRFHSIIFALTSLVPSIAIGYGGNKARGIMGEFNLDDFIIQIQDVHPELLINMFEKGILEYDRIRYRLSTSMKVISDSRSRLINDIRTLCLK